MAFPCVESANSGDAGDLLIRRGLVEQFGQLGCVAHIGAHELRRPTFQRLFLNSNVDLAPDAAFGAAVIARIPRRFAHDLDPGAVDQKVQRPLFPRNGMLTFRVFWRLLRMLKVGTAQFRSISPSKVSTNPVFCRSAIPDNTFMVRQVRMAASL